MGQLISKRFTTKNTIKSGKVFVSWRGDNIDEVLKKLKAAIKMVNKSKKEDGDNWMDYNDVQWKS